MSETFDEMKGRTKQAVGDLADDEELRREGRIDRGVASAKEAVSDVAGAAKGLADKAGDRLKDAFDR